MSNRLLLLVILEAVLAAVLVLVASTAVKKAMKLPVSPRERFWAAFIVYMPHFMPALGLMLALTLGMFVSEVFGVLALLSTSLGIWLLMKLRSYLAKRLEPAAQLMAFLPALTRKAFA